MDNKHYPDSLKIANCQVCTLADVMKDCKNCAFNVGLVTAKSENTGNKVPTITNVSNILHEES